MPPFCAQCGQPSTGGNFCPRCGSSMYGPAVQVVPAAGGAKVTRGRAAGALAVVVALLTGVTFLLTAGSHGTVQLRNAAAGVRDASPSPTAAPVGYASFAQLFKASSGAIVRLTSTGCDYTGVGTGFFTDPHHIATVAHVVAGATSIDAQAAGLTVPVRVIGQDLAQDVALLYTPTAWTGPTIPLSTTPAQVGDSVAALGFPKGLPLSLSRGSVSAVDQHLAIGVVDQHGLVQTDTPLNHGNSGGPLLPLDGKAVGLVDSGRVDANNISYAVGAAVALADFAGWPDSGTVAPTTCGRYANTPYDPTLPSIQYPGTSGSQASGSDPGAYVPPDTGSAGTAPGVDGGAAPDPATPDTGTTDSGAGPDPASPPPDSTTPTDAPTGDPSPAGPSPTDAPAGGTAPPVQSRPGAVGAAPAAASVG